MAVATTFSELKNKVFDYVNNSLASGMVDVELDPSHLEISLQHSLDKYRQLSSNAVEESYAFLRLIPDQQEYILPKEIESVRTMFRATIGSATQSGNQFEPFEAGYLNIYMLQAGRVGGLLTFELFSQYQELTARMFGNYFTYTFNSVTKKLHIVRRPRSENEDVLLWVYNYKPDEILLSDRYSYPWLKEYTLATAMGMLGQARGKFGTIAGPQGGSALNGESLLGESKERITKLETEMANYMAGNLPPSFIIG